LEPAVLGLVLDSTVGISAERRKESVAGLIERIATAFGPVELSLSPVAVGELVHGIYRGNSDETVRRRREFVAELLHLIPVHPIAAPTAWIVGRIHGQEAAKGNTLPFNDLLIAASAIEQGYAVLTGNLRHFQRIPGLRVLSL